MKIAAVIPARMHSVRLPGKPLLKIAGVPMILRVLERARASSGLSRIIVATDSRDIFRVVAKSGGEVWMTSAKHRTGSERVAEVATGLTESLILNIQGDEPLLPLSTIEKLVRFGLHCADLRVATAKIRLTRLQDVANPNIVKVVTSGEGRALYFSRSPVPYHRDAIINPGGAPAATEDDARFYKHIGIYLYRRDFLLDIVEQPPTPLERAEGLEQLRVLETGHPMHVVEVTEDSLSVDTAEDLAAAEALIAAGEKKGSP